MPAMELAVENFKVESGANSNNGTKWKCIGADWLWQQLRSSEPKVTVLDCRSASDFSECHIRQAVHLSLPSIMLRRLAGGKVTISSVLKCTEARQQLAEAYGKHTFVLCGDLMSSERHPHEMLPVLHKSLVQDGCLVVCLEGKHLSLIFQLAAIHRHRPTGFSCEIF
jgi:dual specificity MAP kinase phosphatase